MYLNTCQLVASLYECDMCKLEFFAKTWFCFNLQDYWLTLLHRSLVGETVLDVTASSGNCSELSTIRLYAQCTSDRFVER